MTIVQNSSFYLTVIAVGHLDHGKTTLAAAMTRVASLQDGTRPVPYDRIDNAGEQEANGVRFRLARVEYTMGSGHYVLIDCPGPEDYRRCLQSGGPPLDGAVLVMSAPDGPMPQSREQLLLLRQANIPVVAVFLNKTDVMASPGLIGQAELEARELLAQAGFLAETVPIVRGSALRALESKSSDCKSPDYAPLLDLQRCMDSNLGR